MMTLDAVIRLVGEVEAGELEHWIEEEWVLPDGGADGYLFQDVDVARVRLIVELRRDFAIDEQAMPVVLHLLDQVYALRARLTALCGALEAQPTAVREAIQAHLGWDKDATGN